MPSSQFLFEDFDAAVHEAETQCSQIMREPLFPLSQEEEAQALAEIEGLDHLEGASASASAQPSRGNVATGPQARNKAGAGFGVITWEVLLDALCDLKKLKRLSGTITHIILLLRCIRLRAGDDNKVPGYLLRASLLLSSH
jgi:hypothetical protein